MTSPTTVVSNRRPGVVTSSHDGSRRWPSALGQAIVLPCLVAVALLPVWEGAVRISTNDLVPGPYQVVRGLAELVRKGLLLKYVVASLFRVTWGFSLAVVVGIPFGLLLGWFRSAYLAFNPFI